MLAPLHAAMPRIVVCGDIMLDHYIYTHANKIANEAPIPVFSFLDERHTLGGCGNVLANLSSLGCTELHAISMIGDDDNGRKISSMLHTLNISNHLIVNHESVTTTKIRYFSNDKLLFRSDKERHARVDTASVMARLEKCISGNNIDCIILSDYEKGFLTKELCQSILAFARARGIFTCVDPKRDPTKYIGCSVIKPNLSEAYRLTDLPTSATIEQLHSALHSIVHCRYSAITMAEEGISVYDGTSIFHEKTASRKVVDVTGAGDIVCAILGYYMPISCDIPTIVRTATEVATISVEQPGTYVISKRDIMKLSKIIDIDVIPTIKDLYRDTDIVFTNGCFDLLHEGHLALLNFCKGKGGIVIVGVNSDESVKGLKGPTRPIHNQRTRASILAALSCIDYVIVFDEPTPLEIIQKLEPDVLVKGGDYTVDSIVGREYAKRTLIFNLVEGISTSNTIQHITSST